MINAALEDESYEQMKINLSDEDNSEFDYNNNDDGLPYFSKSKLNLPNFGEPDSASLGMDS